MLTGAVGNNILLEVDPAVCHTCHRCQAKKACPRNAIRIIDKGESPFLDPSLCWRCLTCMHACPYGAIVHHTIEPPAV